MEAHPCGKCGRGFSTESALNIHLRSHFGERPNLCDTCGKEFTTKKSLQLHLRQHSALKQVSGDERGSTYGGKQCTLPVYQSEYAQMSSMQLLHAGDTKPFACTRCHERFSSRSQLNVHERRHTGEKAHPCDKCDKRFYSAGRLQKHERAHTAEKTNFCPRCFKIFENGYGLACHLQTHGADAYACDQCGELFPDARLFLKHKRQHGRNMSAAP